MSDITVIVESLSGRELNLVLPATATAFDLKKAVHEHWGTPWVYQQIVLPTSDILQDEDELILRCDPQPSMHATVVLQNDLGSVMRRYLRDELQRDDLTKQGFVLQDTHSARVRLIDTPPQESIILAEKRRVRRPLDEETEQEFAKLKEVTKHENLLQLIDVINTDSAVWALHAAPDGDVGDVIQVFADAQVQLPTVVVSHWLIQLLQGLCHLHSHDFVHGSLEPQKVFAVRRWQLLRIGGWRAEEEVRNDRARARVMDEGPTYLPPEYAIREIENCATTDMWSLGVLLFELRTFHKPFKGTDVVEVCLAIRAGLVLWDLWPDDGLLKTCHRLLEQQPEHRATAPELLLHNPELPLDGDAGIENQEYLKEVSEIWDRMSRDGRSASKYGG